MPAVPTQPHVVEPVPGQLSAQVWARARERCTLGGNRSARADPDHPLVAVAV
ncbi:hypothetical protein ACFPRL_10310 [Pseudoclavibacter helvolus]